MSELWFRFRREGETYSGSFAHGDPMAPSRLAVAVTWDGLLRMLAQEVATAPPDVQLYVLREDSQFLTPTLIPSDTVTLFRDDPISAIREWTVKSADYRASLPPPPIPVGHPVLARMFGESIYLSMDSRRGRVESPITGEMEVPAKLFFRNGCGWIPLRKVSKEWCLCSVEDLLRSSTVDKFYLPRPWNPYGPWMSRGDLRTKLGQFRFNLQKAISTQ